MRKSTAWFAGLTVVAAMGAAPVALKHDVTMRDGDRLLVVKHVRWSEAVAVDTWRGFHWPSGKRNLTIVNTHPSLGYGEALQAAVAEWNAAGADVHLAYTEGPGTCSGTNGSRIDICYGALPGNVVGQAWNWYDGDHAVGGWIDLDPSATDPDVRRNTACHEIGHELGFGHPADGSPGPCDGHGHVRADERLMLRAMYYNSDVPIQKGQCNDGIDNDGDGLVDELDPGCVSAGDPSELNPAVRAPATPTSAAKPCLLICLLR